MCDPFIAIPRRRAVSTLGAGLILGWLVALLGCSSSSDAPGASSAASSSAYSSPSAPPPTPEPITPAGQPIAATHAAAAMGAGFNLGQMFDNTQHPRTFAAAQPKIDAYYDLGYRNLRIPITWTDTVGGDRLVNDPDLGDLNWDHPRLNEITQVIDYALSLEGMYVTINAHHERDLKNDNKWWVLERLWLDIATKFGDRDYRLMFQLLNEPHLNNGEAMPPGNLRFMSGKAYDMIRAVNPERIIIIGGNQWFAAHEMATVWPNLEPVGGGEDPYVMASFHHYNPWEFSGDNQADYAYPWTEEHLSSPFETMLEWSRSAGNNMPIYVSEWGVGWQSVLPTMDCNNIRKWYAQLHYHQAAVRGVPTSVWDDGGWFRIFDHGSHEFNNELAICLIEGECDWSGSERFNMGCYSNSNGSPG